MRHLFSFLFLFVILLQASAQDGAPLLTNFRQSRDPEDQSWAICQDRNKVMLFANRKGILSFDGEEWTPIRLPLTPFSMEMNPYDQKIYVGGENNYGFLEKDPKGLYKFVSLVTDSSETGLITKIIFNDSLACFYSEKTISCYNFRSDNLQYRLNSGEHSFTGMFMNSKNTFVNVAGRGLFRIEKDTLFPIVTGHLTQKTEILFSLPYDKNMVLLGLSTGKLSLFDGLKYYEFPVKDDGYLQNNILSEGISIGDSLYAFSTLEGGALVVDREGKKVMFTINNQSGLPDDEVFAMGHDLSGGLWLSHSFGLTRADLNIPVRNYSIYPGLKGNLTSSVRYNNELFVGTSEGVYYLANERSYTEIEILRENEIKSSPKLNAVPSNVIVEKTLMPPRQQNQKKGIFNRLFGKKNSDEQAQKTTPIEVVPATVAVESVPVPKYTAQKVKKLKSIDYLYKKVSGLDEKCRQLVATRFGILAATNRGLYVIKNHTASLISGDCYVNQIAWEPYGETWPVATANGYFLAVCKNGKWTISIPDESFSVPLYSIVRTGEREFWLGGDNAAFKAEPDSDPAKIKYEKYSVRSNYSQRYLLGKINDSIFLMTETAVNSFNSDSERFMEYSTLPVNTYRYKGFTYPLSNLPLINTGDEWIYIERNSRIKDIELRMLRLFDDIVSINCENNNIWIIDGENKLYGINRNISSRITPCTELLIKNIRNDKGISFDLSNIVFDRGDNVINFEIVAPAYMKKNLTRYQYYIPKIMPGWSAWSNEKSYSKGIPSSGDYTLLVRAMDIWGEVGEPVSVLFTIKAPFTKTSMFYILILTVIFIIIFLVVNFREKQLQEKNRVLEEKVRERTAEIEAQKEEITSSIEYASRIQMAMLPVSSLFNESFSDFFIIYKPRDIVSGDFYWIGEDEKHIFLTVADCTGHGVPGAFMSALGISILNEIVTHNDDLQANVILNQLREKIKNSLHQTGKEGEAADGMDISLCVLRKNRKSLQFSGAYNPLFFCNNGDLKEFKADRMPIGIHYGDEASFTNHEIGVRKGDVVYLMSDGITDQFGGADGTKFKKAQLKNILSEIHTKPMADQKRIIESEFLKWKGKNEQVDDITIIGVRI